MPMRPHVLQEQSRRLTLLSGSSRKSSQRLRPSTSSHAKTALYTSLNAFFILSLTAGGSSSALVLRRFCQWRQLNTPHRPGRCTHRITIVVIVVDHRGGHRHGLGATLAFARGSRRLVLGCFPLSFPSLPSSIRCRCAPARRLGFFNKAISNTPFLPATRTIGEFLQILAILDSLYHIA